MGPLRWRAVPFVLLLAAACGGAGARPDRVLSAAATASPEAPATVPPTTATTMAPTTTTTWPVLTSTTVRPSITTLGRSTTTRPPATATPASAGYAPPAPPPGVVADGYGGYGGVATTTADDATVALSLYPREQYFGEPVQVGVEVTTKEFVAVKIDMGNGATFDVTTARGGQCSAEPRTASGGAPYYVYPAPGQYRIRAIVTVIPCIPIPGPPGSPPGAPSPFERHIVEASIGVNERPDTPPRPIGPPPGP
jgi:hypothetical protein